MKKLILLKLLFLFISLSTLAQNINIQKETFVYATKDRIELKLDKYNINDSLENKPCIIFMFGGGFVSGERDNKDYLEYFDFLANNGNLFKAFKFLTDKPMYAKVCKVFA